MKLRLTKSLLLTLFMAPLLAGCFTGVESTPKITAKDVKRQKVTVTEEELFLGDVASMPIGSWMPGKSWLVTDSKINLAIEPGMTRPLALGDTLRYVSATDAVSVTGAPVTELRFAAPGGMAVYRVNASSEDLAARKSVSIPFAVELSIVDQATRDLMARRLFLRNSSRYDGSGNVVYGRKFIPVVIDAVTPGNEVYPVKLHFTPDDKNDLPGWVYLNVGDAGKGNRGFASLFYFKNPRERYPDISPENWNAIMANRLEPDMTREEARLAVGAPASIDRRNAITTLQEVWRYDDGTYLMFEDGLLRAFRR